MNINRAPVETPWYPEWFRAGAKNPAMYEEMQKLLEEDLENAVHPSE